MQTIHCWHTAQILLSSVQQRVHCQYGCYGFAVQSGDRASAAWAGRSPSRFTYL